jgi:two-component system sensor histidine kinase AtoS
MGTYGTQIAILAGQKPERKVLLMMTSAFGTTHEVNEKANGEFDRDVPVRLVDQLSAGVIVADEQGRISLFNQAAALISGTRAQEMLGQPLDRFFNTLETESSKLSFARLCELSQSMRVEVELSRDRHSRTTLQLDVSPLFLHDGRFVGLGIELQDISCQKKMEEQALRTSRLTAMGEMALKIAHDIRNPLGSIELFASSLEEDLQKMPELKAMAGHISSGVHSINTIVTNLLLFIRHDDSFAFTAVDLKDVLHESLFFSEHMMTPNNDIHLETRIGGSGFTVQGDAELLKQVMLNLILNAIQAMPAGGRLSISALRHTDRRALLRVEDTGCGIPRHLQQRIFDPFYSTKRGGTGLGMSIVHNIVTAHGGTVDVDSIEGQGTRIGIMLPLTEDIG